MTRREDWPERLADVLERRRDTPFAWGDHDCALWAARCIADITGEHPLPEAIGAYTDAASAAAWLQARGWASLAECATALLGPPLDAPAYAQRGDVVLYDLHALPGVQAPPADDHDARYCLGVCIGATAAMPGAHGLHRVPMRHAVAAWRV